MALKPQKQIGFPGAGYPAGRPSYFGQRFLKSVFREGAMAQYGLSPWALCVLLKIATEEDDNRYQRPASLFNSDLARDLNCSEDTIQRARAELVRAGLLHYERDSDRRSGVYWLKIPPHWESLNRFNAAEGPPIHRTGTVVPAAAVAEAVAAVPADQSFPNTVSPVPPSPPSRTWEEVEGKLAEAGITMSRRAIKIARREGYTPDQAFACCEHFLQHHKANGWRPGLLWHRFEDHPPGTLPGVGWPCASPQNALRWTAEQEAARASREAEQTAQQRALADVKAAEVAEPRKRREQLLLQFGDEIDRLTPDQRVELLRDQPLLVQLLTRIRHQWREDAMVRFALCEAIASKHGSN